MNRVEVDRKDKSVFSAKLKEVMELLTTSRYLKLSCRLTGSRRASEEQKSERSSVKGKMTLVSTLRKRNFHWSNLKKKIAEICFSFLEF